MTLVDFTSNVQALFPVKFIETFMYDEDTTNHTKIINIAIKYALSRFEKIESNEVTGSGIISRAASIVKCIPSLTQGRENLYNVFNIGFQSQNVWSGDVGGVAMGRMPKIKHYFNPDSKLLLLFPGGAAVYIEYVVDSTLLTILDLDDIYIQWAMKYANALLMIKEGMLGLGALPNIMPFEFNYSAMKESGESQKKELEDELIDMYQGTLAIRTS